MCLPPVPEGEIRPITFLFCLSVICLMKKTQQKSLKNKINFFVCGAPTSFFPRFLISGRENFFLVFAQKLEEKKKFSKNFPRQPCFGLASRKTLKNN